jgi:acyl transferase domain-containing protein
MPVVRGIFHLAGALDDGLLPQQTWPRFSSVLAPKLRGAWNLHQQTAHLSLDLFVLFSSAASILGAPGQGTYAAANAFLDTLAHFRRASGLSALSINWGPWAEVGMAMRVPQSARRWSQQGILGIEPQAGLEILVDLLEGGHTQCAVLHVNPSKLRRTLAEKHVPFFESLLRSSQSHHEIQEPELRRVLQGSPAAQRHARVQEFVQRTVMRVLGFAADQPVDPRRAFRELGLDSLLAVDLVHSLSNAWGKPLSPTLLFRHSDIESLARYFVDEMGVAPTSPTPARAWPPPTRPAAFDDSIAIVGMGCRFPGGAIDPDSFWHLLRSGADAIVEVPADRWPVDSFYDPDPDAPGKMYTRWGGFLKDVDRFDPAFFGIAAGEALSMDPQQRLFLEVAWEALENAGIPADRLAGTETGVFLGISTGDYSTLTLGGNDPRVVDAFFGTGSAACIAAGRLSYLLGLKGPNLALDTGCSSSLVALHLACQSLRSGESRVAIAAGVNLILSPIATIYFCRLRAMARDGRCKTFSSQADGFVRGEGCGVVVLKRLSDAIADRDHIEAIVRGTAMNHDGHSNGLTAPNAAAQAEVIERCLQAAGLTSQDISFIETHGSGTALGDPVECSAITEVFGKEPRPPLALGAVKSNIGHLEAAAGVAGLIKLVLALQHGEIPANLHCEERNPRIDWQQMPLLVPTAHQKWPGSDGPRRGGVSSFSFSGTNIHAILEEPPEDLHSRTVSVAPDRPRHVLAISAQCEPALQELIGRYRTFVEEHPELSLADICFSANTGRSVWSHRLAVIAESRESMLATLERCASNRSAEHSWRGVVGTGTAPKLALFFPGGDEFPTGLGAELFATQPTFRAAIERCESLLQSDGLSILPIFRGESEGQSQSHIALFCLESALADLWRAWEVQSTWVAGEGVGAVAAAYMSGGLTLADALQVVLQQRAARHLSDARKPVGVPDISALASWKQQGCEQVVCLGPYSRPPVAELEFINCLDAQGRDCLLDALARLYVRGVTMDWRAFDRDYPRLRLRVPNYPFQRQSYWLDHRVPTQTADHRSPLQPEKTPLVQELEVVPRERQLPRINQWLKQHVAALLGRAPESVPDGSVGFFDMGLDSLKAIELGMRMRGDLGDRIPLPSTLTFDYPNLDALGGFIADSLASSVPHVTRTESERGSGGRPTIDRDEPIAVIGIGCKFPGGADGPERFWDMLRGGRDAVGPVPSDRWPIAQWFDPNPDAPGKMYCARGAFLPRVDLFDAWFFGISPREANYLDPQQRLLLEVTWEALEHAALAPQRLVGSRTGVFVGISGNEYMHRIGVSAHEGSAYIGVGNSPSAAAGRLSYVLGLQGPSLVVDTACSSSLVAVHEACQSLRAGESDHAIAAGVNVLLSPWAQVNLCQAKMLAPDGRCKTFSDAADGYGRGEGCGVVILKRLSDALRDKDRIWSVVRASGVNQDGRSSGLTVPNGPAQQSLIRDVLARASVSPTEVDYVEAHGTGTSLGDPIELHALAAAYGAGRAAGQPLRVGSVKTNIGHLEAAAGIAGLIKVILAMNHDLIPAHLHCDQLTDRVAWDQLPMVINRQPFAWTRNGKPRRAAVSSFGFVGTNAHVLVEDLVDDLEDPIVAGEPPINEPAPAIRPQHYLMTLSAKDEAALGEMAQRLSAHLESHSELDPSDVSRTLTWGRSHFEHRLAVVASSIDEACSLLTQRRWLTKDSITAQKLSQARHTLDHLEESTSPELEELLATAYVTGENVDWARYWSVRPGRCVSVPTYAFQRQRYWIEESEPKDRDRTTAKSASQTSPLLGRRLSSVLEAVQFESRWSLTQLPFLADHCLYDNVVVPGAAYLAMWLAAGKHLGDGAGAQTLREVSFPQSLILADDQERTVQLIAQPQGAGQYDCRICSLESASENWITHATAQWSAGVVAPLAKGDSREPAGGRSHTSPPSGTTRVESFYELTKGGGLRLGSTFQWIDDLWRAPGDAWASFRNATSDDPGGPIHPGLIDACFQVLGSAMPFEKLESNAFIPVGLDALTLSDATPGGKLWCRGRLRDSELDERSSFVGDVCLYDEAGNIRLQLEGVRLQSAPRQSLLSTATLPRHASYELVWRSSRPSAASNALLQHWIILADRRGFGAQVAERLRASGAECHTIPPLPDAQERLDALRSVFMLYRGDKVGIISLWALDADGPSAPLEAITSGVLDLMHLHRQWSSIERLWLVTAGAQIVSRTEEAIASIQAATWGLGRALAREHPAWRCTLVDLDSYTGESVTRLLSELQCNDEEDQVAWRSDGRYVARLASLPLTKARRFARDDAYTLSLEVRGVADSLVLAPCARRAPAAGEIEIRVAAAALNFRDVLNVLDLYPVDPGPLGLECSGIVTAVGEGVADFSVGDEVVALAPACFSRYALTRQELAAHKPSHLDFAEAAGIPVAFLTASYALERLAKLSAGESVLIHLGTGGVGLAAIQLAQRLKATIFATAGSDEKRAFLKSLGILHAFDSRSPEFAVAIRELTRGQGIDVVLNSLSGDLLNASLQCLKPNGRFIEIGKIGIKSSAEFQAQWPQARYEVFALDDLVSSQSLAVGSVLSGLMKRFADGVLHPCPHRSFSLGQAPAAFRLMSRARHIGKVVLMSGADASAIARSHQETRGLIDSAIIDSNGTYLITGASGGLGQQVALWLADQGAKRLVLAARRNPDETAQAAIARLVARGVEVSVQQADVARREDVVRVIQECGSNLRGVFHLAGVIDDALLMQMNARRWQRVWQPKVLGAWNLHEETRGLPLDFFVLFSSAAAILGSAGQANYAAANAALDMLAHERRQEGLPAQSINWGPWSDVGMAARLGSKGAQRFTSAGIGMLSPAQGLALFDAIIAGNHAQVVAMPLDIDKLQSLSQSQGVPPLFSELVGSSSIDTADAEWIDQLHNASRADQRLMVLARLRAQVALVLGLEAGRLIDVETPLRDIGMDSLMAVELTRRISAEVGRNVPTTILFEYTNLNALAGFVLSQLVPADETHERPAVPGNALEASETPEPDLSFIEGLPSDQLHTRLEEELSLIDDVLRRGNL